MKSGAMVPCSFTSAAKLSRKRGRASGSSEGRAHLSFCELANTFALTPCFSWGLGDLLPHQPFQRLSADDKPLKAVARLRPPSPTPLKQGVNERAVNTAVHQRCLLVQKAPGLLKVHRWETSAGRLASASRENYA